MPHYELVQTLGADMPTRYSANGKRISKADYDMICETALRQGHLDCFHTQAKPMEGGRFRRKNYSCARWES